MLIAFGGRHLLLADSDISDDAFHWQLMHYPHSFVFNSPHLQQLIDSPCRKHVTLPYGVQSSDPSSLMGFYLQKRFALFHEKYIDIAILGGSDESFVVDRGDAVYCVVVSLKHHLSFFLRLPENGLVVITAGEEVIRIYGTHVEHLCIMLKKCLEESPLRPIPLFYCQVTAPRAKCVRLDPKFDAVNMVLVSLQGFDRGDSPHVPQLYYHIFAGSGEYVTIAVH